MFRKVQDSSKKWLCGNSTGRWVAFQSFWGMYISFKRMILSHPGAISKGCWSQATSEFCQSQHGVGITVLCACKSKPNITQRTTRPRKTWQKRTKNFTKVIYVKWKQKTRKGSWVQPNWWQLRIMLTALLSLQTAWSVEIP